MFCKALREILQFQLRTLGSEKFDIIFKKRRDLKDWEMTTLCRKVYQPSQCEAEKCFISWPGRTAFRYGEAEIRPRMKPRPGSPSNAEKVRYSQSCPVRSGRTLPGGGVEDLPM